MSKSDTVLNEIYKLLYSHFGPQHWWPGDSPFEICLGAILTQNTNWTNVEKAIENLKKADLLDYKKLYNASDEDIAQLIKPAGYFNSKTKRIRNFLNAIYEEVVSFDGLFELKKEDLRLFLLHIKGVGPETADSMLLYAFNHPIFVVDAYTKRILMRHSLIDEEADYFRTQELFENNLDTDEKFFNEYHALIVKTGKEYCLKSNPKCHQCPLKEVNGGPVL